MRILREWAESLAFTVVFVLIFTSFVAQATQVPTGSMKPAIMEGDHFFLDKLAFPANYPEFLWPYLPERSLERGDIVAFHAPDGSSIPFVKRIVGLPGDVVDIRDKVVYINDKRLDEPYKIHVYTEIYTDDPWTPEGLRVRDNYGPVTLLPDAYFVMGDNRDDSNDSRYWGFISRTDVIGKPLFVYWSYEGGRYSPGRRSMIDRIRGYGSVAANFFTNTRWFRTGVMVR
jgi:signal peptidase I